MKKDRSELTSGEKALMTKQRMNQLYDGCKEKISREMNKYYVAIDMGMENSKRVQDSLDSVARIKKYFEDVTGIKYDEFKRR